MQGLMRALRWIALVVGGVALVWAVFAEDTFMNVVVMVICVIVVIVVGKLTGATRKD